MDDGGHFTRLKARKSENPGPWERLPRDAWAAWRGKV